MLFRKRSLCAPHTGGEVRSPSFQWSVCIIFWNSSTQRDFPLPPNLIYSVVYCLSMDLWIFIYSLIYNPILLKFVTQIILPLANYFTFHLFRWFLSPPSLLPPPGVVWGRLTPRSLAPFNATGSCVCFLPSAGVNHLSKEHWLPLLEEGIRNQDLNVRHTQCY